QAGGSFAPLERSLTSAGMTPRPTPLSREQLDAANVKKVSAVEEADQSDAERVDALLKERCLGESLDGTLADTHTQPTCKGADDLAELVALIDRANRGRQQVWGYLGALKPSLPAGEVRQAWREQHLHG